MDVPPPQDDDPIITQFRPVDGQWELNDENIKRIDSKTGETILYNYRRYINTTPLEVYRYLIETKGCDVNVQDNNKDIPLHYALSSFNPNEGGDITVLAYLLSQRGINSNVKNSNGSTLLHIACIKINDLPLDVFKLLIETKGCDINVQNNDKNTPLHHALCNFNPNKGGEITVLMYLVNQMNINVNTKGYNGYTILHTACQNINRLPIDIFKLLIETHGTDVNAQDNHKNTPLHYALTSFNPNNGGNIQVLHYLLNQEGANGNIKGYSGETLLHEACKYINKLPIDIFKLLIETKGCDVNVQAQGNNTPLHIAFRPFHPNDGGDITVLMYLLNQKGINGNIKGYNGYTLLHYACEKINILSLDVFKVLIERIGCDVNVQDNHKNTPLHNALSRFSPNEGGEITVLTYLLNQKGTNGDINDKSRSTLLHAACENINALPIEIFKLLIETLGYDLNAKDYGNDTPIHNALGYFDPNKGGEITVLTYLLTHKGVNGRTKGKSGDTLLHYACESINDLPLDVFKLLIETKGCDVNAQDKYKDTPLHQALEHLNPHDDHLVPVLQYLFGQTNADVTIKGERGYTILHLACIREIGYGSDDSDGSDDEDDDDSDEGLEDSVIEDIQNQKADTNLCQIVEAIAERCVQQVLDETRF
jgi:ankyrin repeat protein